MKFNGIHKLIIWIISYISSKPIKIGRSCSFLCQQNIETVIKKIVRSLNPNSWYCLVGILHRPKVISYHSHAIAYLQKISYQHDVFEKFVSEHHQVLLPYQCQRKDFLNLGIPPASSNDASLLNLLLSNNQS